MPPARPTVPACSAASSTESRPSVRPMATPAAESTASSSTASPLADSQPKTAAPHLIPPKRARCAATASRAAPRVAVAPSTVAVAATSSSPAARCWAAIGALLGRGFPACPGPTWANAGEEAVARSGDGRRRRDGPAGGRGERGRRPAGRLVAGPGRRDRAAAGPAGRAPGTPVARTGRGGVRLHRRRGRGRGTGPRGDRARVGPGRARAGQRGRRPRCRGRVAGRRERAAAGGHRRPRAARAAAGRGGGSRPRMAARAARRARAWIGGQRGGRAQLDRWTGGTAMPLSPAPRPGGSQVVLVTGASSGIGRAGAVQLAERGATVVLVARGRPSLEQAAAEVRAAGAAEAVVCPADVTDADALRAVVETTVRRFGRLDVVVHAAQVMAYGRVEDVPREVFERVVDTA